MTKFKRVLSWRGLVLIFGLLVVGVTIFYAEENWRGRRAWEKYREQARARGELPDASILVPPRVPDEDNFAMTPFLAPLYDFYPGTQQQRDTNSVARAQNFPPLFNAAFREIKPPKVPQSNSWFNARTDLVAWQVAYEQNRKQSRDRLPRRSEAEAGEGAPQNNQPTETPRPVDSATNQKAAQAILADLSECEPVLHEIEAASARPYSRFNLRYENDDPAAVLLPHLAVLKHLCQVLQLRASAYLAVGEADLAFKDINLMFYITDSIRNEPLVISHLVRFSELAISRQPLADGLTRHQWSDAQLRAFQERLAQFDLCADLKRSFEGERVLLGDRGIQWIQAKPYSRFKLICQIPFDKPRDWDFDMAGAVLSAMPKGWYYFERLNYNRFLEDSILRAIDLRARKISPAACRDADSRFAHVAQHPLLRHQIFSALLLPALTKAVQRTAFAQAGVDASMLACALERFRLAHGSFPETLEGLVPQFIQQLPHDIINGQPLKYHRAQDGLYLLYSVGWNEADDGGVVAMKGKDSQVDLENGDWVWRLEN